MLFFFFCFLFLLSFFSFSKTRPGLTLGRESDVSRPPSYRSRCSSVNPRRGALDSNSNQQQTSSPRHAEGIPEASDPNAGNLANNGGGGQSNNALPHHHSRDASLTVSLLSQELGELDPGNGAVMGDFAAGPMYGNGIQSPVSFKFHGH
jgi:hypothetical protein